MYRPTGPRILRTLKRLTNPERFWRFTRARFGEPLHLVLLSSIFAVTGYRRRVKWDNVHRPQYAFPILWAADLAKEIGLRELTIIEFGVAAGAGLRLMHRYATKTTAITGIKFRIVGFDAATGMPPAIDYRDNPEMFQQGDFPMWNRSELERWLPENVELQIGHIAETVSTYLPRIRDDAPLAFISIDVDYYSSTVPCLQILTGQPEQYLPYFHVYLDDISGPGGSPWTGEMLAVNEFNARHEKRKIAPPAALRELRMLQRSGWMNRMFMAHVFDHPFRSPKTRRTTTEIL